MSLSMFLVPIAIGAASTVVSYAIQEKVDEGILYRMDTNMKDEAILAEALNHFGCNVDLNEETFKSSLGNIQMAFQQQEDGTFSGYFNEQVSTDEAEEFLKDVQKEYTRIVQKSTYETLLTRAKEQGLRLEQEQKNDDETIVLTFQVKE